MSNLKEVSATGDVTTSATATPSVLYSVTLSAGADAASVVIRDGSGGAIKLTLKAAILSTVSWKAGNKAGILMGTGIHATVTGTAPAIDIEYA